MPGSLLVYLCCCPSVSLQTWFSVWSVSSWLGTKFVRLEGLCSLLSSALHCLIEFKVLALTLKLKVHLPLFHETTQ